MLTADDTRPMEKRKSPLSNEQIITAILKELYERKQRGDESGVSVHTLSSMPGIPTQRDQRVKEILATMSERGYVEPIKIEERMGYRLTLEGQRFWVSHGLALSVISAMSMRRKAPSRL